MSSEQFDRAMEELRRSFPAGDDVLARCRSILRCQYRELAFEPPAAELPDAVRLAAESRLRAGECVMPPDRFPLESGRVARLLREISLLLLPSPPDLPANLPSRLDPALLHAARSEGASVAGTMVELGFGIESGVSLFREALKPELLRTSRPFQRLVGTEQRSSLRCPLCKQAASFATSELVACCRWCGTTWPARAEACPSCEGSELRRLELSRVVQGATLLQCTSCTDVLKLFQCSADALVLSMHAVLVAPFELALRVGAGGRPGEDFRVF